MWVKLDYFLLLLYLYYKRYESLAKTEMLLFHFSTNSHEIWNWLFVLQALQGMSIQEKHIWKLSYIPFPELNLVFRLSGLK